MDPPVKSNVAGNRVSNAEDEETPTHIALDQFSKLCRADLSTRFYSGGLEQIQCKRLNIDVDCVLPEEDVTTHIGSSDEFLRKCCEDLGTRFQSGGYERLQWGRPIGDEKSEETIVNGVLESRKAALVPEEGVTTHTGASAFIPDDLIREIFLRVPLKTLVRFRGINKNWCNEIDGLPFRHAHHRMRTAETGNLKTDRVIMLDMMYFDGEFDWDSYTDRDDSRLTGPVYFLPCEHLYWGFGKE